jgi:hypothetical protein
MSPPLSRPLERLRLRVRRSGVPDLQVGCRGVTDPWLRFVGDGHDSDESGADDDCSSEGPAAASSGRRGRHGLVLYQRERAQRDELERLRMRFGISRAGRHVLKTDACSELAVLL